MNKIYHLSHSKPRSSSSLGLLRKLLFTTSLILLGQLAFGQVSGTVFKDFNSNGAKDAFDIGVGGISVKATNASGTVFGPSTTAADGTYTIAGVTGDVRIEFTLPSSVGCNGEQVFSGPGGSTGTSVQFITAPKTNVNLGINNPVDYMPDVPRVVTTCFTNGERNLDKTQTQFGNQVGVKDMDVLVGFGYDKPVNIPGDAPRNNGASQVTPNNIYMSQAFQMGSVWGLAYQKESKKLFVSAFMRRGAQFGPLGTGGLYMVNNADGPSFNPIDNRDFIDLKNIGIDTGTDPHPSNPSGTNQDAFEVVFCDGVSFDKVGKIGVGDIDFSDDGKDLYLTNLNDRTLYKIAMGNPAIVPDASKVTKYSSAPWLTESCTNGVSRPFATKFYRGKLYVGVVCTGENGGSVNDLFAKVYELNALTDQWTPSPVATIPLNYTKGKAADGTNVGSTDKGTTWNPWKGFTGDDGTSNGNYSRPSPILSDIEFDTDGSMIVGLMDRAGHQIGLGVALVLQDGSCVKDPNRGFGPFVSVNSGGDILRLGKKSDCTLELESNGTAAGKTSNGVGNGQGIGGGEYYWGEYIGGDQNNHQETFVGGLALAPGKNQLLGSIYDPFGFVSGGISFFDNTTGNALTRYEVFSPATPTTGGKGNGLGDVELIAGVAPIEIGNRVWKDTDKDGVQDAGELGVDGVAFELYEGTTATGTPAQTVTSATVNGQAGTWFFTNLKANQDYVIKVKTALGSGPLVTCTAYSVTGAGTPTTDNNTTTGLIALKTGNAGENNHSFDVGVVEGVICVVPMRLVKATDPTCAAAGNIELTSVTGGDKYGISNGATYTGQAYASATANGTLPAIIKNNILNIADSVYTIRVFNATNDCFKDTTVTVKAAPVKPTITQQTDSPFCRTAGTTYTIKFTATGGTVTTVPSFAVTGDSIANIPIATASVKVLVTSAGGCKDSITVAAPNCLIPKGSIGDYVWKDANNNGIQDASELPVKGVIVQLLQGTAVVSTDTTDAAGLYLFPNLSSGTYQVKILTASLPAGCVVSTMKDAGTDDTKDSDIDPATGLSPSIVIDANGTGIAKDNLTVDAALFSPCVKPNAGSDQLLVCSVLGTSTADLSDAATGQKWKVLSVQSGTTVSVTTPEGLVSGMSVPGTYQFVLQTQSDSLACRDTVSVIVPDCACPTVNVLTPNATVCKDSLFPTLNISIVGSNTNGVSAAWYANINGGAVLGTGLSFKPVGVASVTDTFYVQLTGTTGACAEAARTAVIVMVQDCNKIIDLALKKGINTKIAKIGDELIYTIKVFSQPLSGSVTATGVEVTDSIATTVQFVAGSFVASRGSAVISGNVIKWTIGTIAANTASNGDTVTLTYKVKATVQGVHFNTAEISKTNEKDVDSMPGNGKDGEDDIDRQCFTVPFTICSNEKIEASIPARYTGVKWFKDGVEVTALAGKNVVLLDMVGTYSFTATNQTCPASGCCPIIIGPGTNCCPTNICVPFTITKMKKK